MLKVSFPASFESYKPFDVLTNFTIQLNGISTSGYESPAPWTARGSGYAPDFRRTEFSRRADIARSCTWSPGFPTTGWFSSWVSTWATGSSYGVSFSGKFHFWGFYFFWKISVGTLKSVKVALSMEDRLTRVNTYKSVYEKWLSKNCHFFMIKV